MKDEKSYKLSLSVPAQGREVAALLSALIGGHLREVAYEREAV